MSDFIVIDSTEKVFLLAGFLIAIPEIIHILILYFYNKYYINKHKDDFLYLFWGYRDAENKISADKYLSLIIYHFISFYILSSYKWVDKRYKIFPEDIKEMDPNSFMPNATKDNLDAFEKKHLKWIKSNVISQYTIVILVGIIFLLFYMSDKI